MHPVEVKHALIVDDVGINRLLAKQYLIRQGFTVHELDTGVLVSEWLQSNQQVQLILLDINMPILSGEDVCIQLRQKPEFSKIRIIAYTAHAGSEDKKRYLENGFDAVLVKPITLQHLTEVLHQVL